MRVIINNGLKTVEIEDNRSVWPSDKGGEITLNLVRDAIIALGYNEADLLAAFASKKSDD